MPLKAHRDGILLFVKLTPKAAKDNIQKIEAGTDGQLRLKASVTAIPEKGKANIAAIKLLAKKLGLPKTSLTLIAGEQSRLKTILVRGDAATLENALKERLSALGLMD